MIKGVTEKEEEIIKNILKKARMTKSSLPDQGGSGWVLIATHPLILP